MTAESDRAQNDEGAERVRRKRRRRRARDAGATRERLDADGRERPAFLLGFPQDPELEPLIAAFEAGNYLFVRTQAPRVAEQATDPAVRDAALELLRRIQPDPLIKYLLVVSVALLVFLIIYAYGAHDHP